jgi:hypothetical protein
LSYSTGVFCASPESSPSPPQWVAHTRKPSLERKNSVLTWQDAELLGPDSVHITELELEWAGRKRFASPAPVSAASPLASIEDAEMADPQQRTEQNQEEEVVVVHTCVPCDPPVSATQVEGEFPFISFLEQNIDMAYRYTGVSNDAFKCTRALTQARHGFCEPYASASGFLLPFPFVHFFFLPSSLILPHPPPQRRLRRPPKPIRKRYMGPTHHRAPISVPRPHPKPPQQCTTSKRGCIPERRARYAFPERVEGFLEGE